MRLGVDPNHFYSLRVSNQEDEADAFVAEFRAEDRRRRTCSFRSFASFCRWARILAYSVASSRRFTARCLFFASRFLFRCSSSGVISRWIFGALDRSFFPSFTGMGRRTTYCRTSSSFDKLNSFLILFARFGPSRRATVLSVNPGISFSPAKSQIEPPIAEKRTHLSGQRSEPELRDLHPRCSL